MRLPINKKPFSAAHIGILIAVTAVLSFVEARLNINFGVPGVKFGLSNIVIVTVLYAFGFKVAFFVTIAKIGFSLIFTSGMSGFLFTAGGSAASLISMYLALRVLKNRVSAVGISAIGGFFHITAQYICSQIIMGSSAVMKIYPIAAGISLITSAAVGFICNILLERVYRICV